MTNPILSSLNAALTAHLAEDGVDEPSDHCVTCTTLLDAIFEEEDAV